MGRRSTERDHARALAIGWDDAAAGADPVPGTPSNAPAPDPAPEPSGHPRRRRRLLLLVTAAALVLALVIALPRLVELSAGPEQAASDFLQAVVDGDLETVREHAEQPPTSSGEALTAEVLGGAERRLEGFEIRDVQIDSGAATVTADLLGQDGPAGEATLALTAVDGGPFSPLEWQLAPVALPELRLGLPSGVEEIEIGGVALPVEALRPPKYGNAAGVSVQLLPGTYEIVLPGEGPWLHSRPLTVEIPATLGAASATTDTIMRDLSEAARQEVEERTTAWLETCAASTSPAPEGCPFAVPETASSLRDGTGTWSVTEAPPATEIPLEAYLWVVRIDGTAEFVPDGGEGSGPVEIPLQVHSYVYIDPSGTLTLVQLADDGLSFMTCYDAESGEEIGVTTYESGTGGTGSSEPSTTGDECA